MAQSSIDEQRHVHQHRLMEQWRQGWQQKDDWTRFAMSWNFAAVVMLRAELTRRA